MSNKIDPITIKFNWKLRSNPRNCEDHPDQIEPKSRNAKYVQKLKKKEKIDDYNKHTKTDAERKLKAYVAIDHMTEENKIENRKRWAEKNESSVRKINQLPVNNLQKYLGM